VYVGGVLTSVCLLQVLHMRNLVRAWLSYGRGVHPGQDAWLLMIDMDAFVMNTSITLQSITEAAKEGRGSQPLDMIIAKDCNGINAGVLLLRMSEWSLDFLNLVWETFNPEIPNMNAWWEQAAIIHLLKNSAELGRHVAIVAKTVLNSYPPAFAARAGSSPCWGSWQEGEFVLHFVDSSKQTDMQGFVPLINNVTWEAMHMI
jgi:hypothetical protein